jgi:hypothetical protein
MVLRNFGHPNWRLPPGATFAKEVFGVTTSLPLSHPL